MYCRKCLTGRTGDVVGGPCRTPGCDGIIEEVNYRDLVEQVEEQLCPRRAESGGGFTHGPDHWDKFKSNGNRVCSYCGSLHPEDFFALVKQSAEAPEDAPYGSVVEIEHSDKGYKIYVHQPGVRNAHEGGIKFYTPHLPKEITDEQNKEFVEAKRRTWARFEKHMKRTK